jgi:hypothetical protein
MKACITILLSLWMLAGLSGPLLAATSIGVIYGSQLACNPANPGCTPIPLTLTTLCTVTCPLRSSFSFTDSARFWGSTAGVGACRTSTDGGVTWAACASQPYAAGDTEHFAGASNGNVIGVGSPAGVCTMSLSTNLGVSWAPVFTQAGSCTTGGLEGQRIYCLSDGRCEFIAVGQIFRTANNGLTWTAGETGIAPNCSIIGMAWDGTAGIAPSQNTGCGGGGVARSFFSSADAWADSVTWNGTQGNCWGTVVYNGTARAICQSASATPDERYTLRDSTGVNIASLTLPGAELAGTSAGGPAISPFTSTLYIFAQSSSGFITVWLSRDNLASFTTLGTFGGGGAGIRGGNTFYSSGCIYLTGGLTPMFGKICP